MSSRHLQLKGDSFECGLQLVEALVHPSCEGIRAKMEAGDYASFLSGLIAGTAYFAATEIGFEPCLTIVQRAVAGLQAEVDAESAANTSAGPH